MWGVYIRTNMYTYVYVRMCECMHVRTYTRRTIVCANLPQWRRACTKVFVYPPKLLYHIKILVRCIQHRPSSLLTVKCTCYPVIAQARVEGSVVEQLPWASCCLQMSLKTSILWGTQRIHQLLWVLKFWNRRAVWRCLQSRQIIPVFDETDIEALSSTTTTSVGVVRCTEDSILQWWISQRACRGSGVLTFFFSFRACICTGSALCGHIRPNTAFLQALPMKLQQWVVHFGSGWMFSEALLMRWAGWRRGCMYGGWGDDLWRGKKADIRMLSFCFSTTFTSLLHERKDKKVHTHTYVRT